MCRPFCTITGGITTAHNKGSITCDPKKTWRRRFWMCSAVAESEIIRTTAANSIPQIAVTRLIVIFSEIGTWKTRESIVATPRLPRKPNRRTSSDLLVIKLMSSALVTSRVRDRKNNKMRTAEPENRDSIGTLPNEFVARRLPSQKTAGMRARARPRSRVDCIAQLLCSRRPNEPSNVKSSPNIAKNT